MSVPRAVSRRAVSGLLAGAAIGLAGCDLLPADDPAPLPAPSADELLVDTVAAALISARAIAIATSGGEAYAALHEAHLAALGRPTGSSATPPATDLVTTERALQTTLADGAVHAEDGGLARLLASMSAAVAQLLHGVTA